jgi:hypothetical protein
VTRLAALGLSRVTLDFDGSVIGTGKSAEGTAVGFNRNKKGQRSYYPLFCMVAQTGQVLDVLHRSGNVHDSHGAKDFILSCIAVVRAALSRVSIEVRMDSAFFSDEIVGGLDTAGVEYTVSVPFERFTDLKARIEARCFWWPGTAKWDYFEAKWKPKAWKTPHRFLFIRTRVKQQHKEPIQLDLFVPHDYGYEFKVILTNKPMGARKALVFHNGRGSQEGILAELKSDNALGYVPTPTWLGNQIYLLSVLLAHNLGRELQMIAHPPSRATLEKRPAFWAFERLDTFRRRICPALGLIQARRPAARRPRGTMWGAPSGCPVFHVGTPFVGAQNARALLASPDALQCFALLRSSGASSRSIARVPPLYGQQAHRDVDGRRARAGLRPSSHRC